MDNTSGPTSPTAADGLRTADIVAPHLEGQPHTRGQRVGVPGVFLHDPAAGAGPRRTPDTLRRVLGSSSETPGAHEPEARVRGEPPRAPETRLGPALAALAR